MLRFDEADSLLCDMTSRVPPAILNGLNGGVVLSPDEKLHPKGKGDLFILGEYRHEPNGLGRYVVIYYGSLLKVCAGKCDDAVKDQLERTLHHELTHHLESLAGDRSLEIKDAAGIAAYMRRYEGQ